MSNIQERKIEIFKQEEVKSLDIKIGLDTVILVHLIVHPELFEKQGARIFNRKGIFYIQDGQLDDNYEIKKVLRDKYNFPRKKAEEAVNKFLKEKNIQVIPKDKSKIIITKQRQMNCINNKIYVQFPDIMYISDFIDNGITKVFSEDGVFIKAAAFLGLNADRIFFPIKK